MVQLMRSSNNLLLFITYHKISFPTKIIGFRQAIVDLLSTLSPLYMFNYSFSRCLKWTFTEAFIKKKHIRQWNPQLFHENFVWDSTEL